MYYKALLTVIVIITVSHAWFILLIEVYVRLRELLSLDTFFTFNSLFSMLFVIISL